MSRKDNMIRKLKLDLEQAGNEASESQRMALEAAGRESSALRQTAREATALRLRLDHLLQAVRSLSRVAHRGTTVLGDVSRSVRRRLDAGFGALGTDPSAAVDASESILNADDQLLQRNIRAVAAAAGMDEAEIMELVNISGGGSKSPAKPSFGRSSVVSGGSPSKVPTGDGASTRATPEPPSSAAEGARLLADLLLKVEGAVAMFNADSGAATAAGEGIHSDVALADSLHHLVHVLEDRLLQAEGVAAALLAAT